MNNDLIRRSELLAKKCVVRGHLDTGSPYPSKVTAIPVDVIERAQAVDAVDVVRCQDCLYWENDIHFCHYHSHYYDGGRDWDRFKPDDFCSYGERKEGAE